MALTLRLALVASMLPLTTAAASSLHARRSKQQRAHLGVHHQRGMPEFGSSNESADAVVKNAESLLQQNGVMPSENDDTAAERFKDVGGSSTASASAETYLVDDASADAVIESAEQADNATTSEASSPAVASPPKAPATSLQANLSTLKVSQLIKRAKKDGVPEALIENAEDQDRYEERASLVRLIEMQATHPHGDESDSGDTDGDDADYEGGDAGVKVHFQVPRKKIDHREVDHSGDGLPLSHHQGVDVDPVSPHQSGDPLFHEDPVVITSYNKPLQHDDILSHYTPQGRYRRAQELLQENLNNQAETANLTMHLSNSTAWEAEVDAEAATVAIEENATHLAWLLGTVRKEMHKFSVPFYLKYLWTEKVRLEGEEPQLHADVEHAWAALNASTPIATPKFLPPARALNAPVPELHPPGTAVHGRPVISIHRSSAPSALRASGALLQLVAALCVTAFAAGAGP